jgi:DUF1680 family protein
MIRFLPSIPGLIYATNRDTLYINLFMSNHAKVQIGPNQAEIIQRTDYPWKGSVSFEVNPAQNAAFTIRLRIPGWSQNQAVPGNLYAYADNNPEKAVVHVNGNAVKTELKKGYVEISREWAKGDKIDLVMPMVVRKVVTSNKVPENDGKVSIEYGPLVYCAEETDNLNLDRLTIPGNAVFKTEERTVLTEKINAIKAGSGKTELSLIPYYLWSNRGAGKMKVWFPATN